MELVHTTDSREGPDAKRPSSGDPCAVLVVESDPQVRLFLLNGIAAAGHRSDGVANLDEAIPLAARTRYDVVIASIADCTGIGRQEFLRSLTGGRSESALLVLTDRGDAGQVQQAFELGAQGFVPKPIDRFELAFGLQAALQQRLLQKESRASGQRMQVEVLRQTKELLDTITRLERTEMQIRRSQEETIHRLARAAEFRDNETGRHLQRMSHYAELLARKSGMDHERCELIRIASPMHDIGKIGIPDQILYKNGKHTPQEFEVMKQHAEMGYTILKGSHSELLDTAAMIAWTHHEKFDGNGYPRGLAGGEIPFEGRVVAIADVFDALTSRRVYKPAFSVEKAQQIMNDGAGKHFDPALLALFWDSMEETLSIRDRYSDPEPAPLPATGG